MRSIAMLATCAGLAVVSSPLVVNAQTTGQSDHPERMRRRSGRSSRATGT